MSWTRVLPAGQRSLLVDLPDTSAVHALAAWVRASEHAGALEEIVPGASTLLVVARADRIGALDRVAAALESADPSSAPDREPRTIEVPVVYDGPDLADVCERTGLSRDDAVAAHRDGDYRVAFLGFSPGFAFCCGVPDTLQLPRRSSPRTSVPVGSVAIANEFTAVYPAATPGGWHLLGRAVGDPMWDTDREPPQLVELGDRIVFVEQS